jgi:pimeloyl-ACP methyl ester carboxylesterase
MKAKQMSLVLAPLVNLVACLVVASCGHDNRSPSDRMVGIGSHRLEMRVEGKGAPAVVIDAGIADQLDKMKPLQDRLARVTQVVTYNRAGYGRSEPGPLPRHAGREAEELKTLLEKASIPGPYVLVGHSLGALNMEMFASNYPGDAAGLVLLDPPPLSFILGQEYKNLQGMAEKMTAEWQAIADSASKSADSQEQAKSAFFRMIASEHREMFGETARMVDAISTFGDIPLVVIAAGKPNPAFGEGAADYQKYWIEQSRALVEKSATGKFILAGESSHYLYLDVPELVVQSILSVVDEVRTKSIIAKCAEAMGGAARIRGIQTLRVEVVYPDHDATAVLQEMRRPNLIRTERPGKYVAIFDGQRGALLEFDPAKPGEAPVPKDLPAEAARGFETDLIWFFPSFFDFPSEYAGIVELKGAKCHKLVVTLPLGTRAEYLIDAQTYLVKTVAVEETYEGKVFRLEREWLDLEPVQGIIYPGRMTYPGRDGKQATAEIKRIEFNPPLSDDRFRIPAEVP